MNAARAALVAHIKTSTVTFELVKPYAGELARSIKNPQLLTVDLPGKNMPAALVLYTRGTLRPDSAQHPFDVLVITRTETLKREANATDALTQAEALALWLMGNFDFTDAGYDYTINLDTGIDTEQVLLSNQYAVVRLGLTIDAITL